MVVYKVIQDIEAEDKLVGPLTLKAFVYAGIAIAIAYIEFRLLLAGGPFILRAVFMLLLLPPMILFGLLAAPIGRDQPTETWLLSHLQFFLKPRKRTWDQAGLSELVTITAPKKIEHKLTDGLTETEVNSRLKALAMTLDSRGWAVKNVGVNLSSAPSYVQRTQPVSDRLVEPASLSQDTIGVDIDAADDMLDEQNNPTAQKFEKMMRKADIQRKASVKESVQASDDTVPDDVDFQFLDEQPGIATQDKSRFVSHKVVTPKHKSHHKAPPKAKVTKRSRADKMELAQSGNDLSVDSISRLANRKPKQQSSPDEVVISLH